MTHKDPLVRKKYQHDWNQKNKEAKRVYQSNWARKRLDGLKQAIFEKLGDKCARCGFPDKRALCIDHVNGGGFKELRGPNGKGRSAIAYYQAVLRDTLGKYQILCHNCNWIKRSERSEVRKPAH